MVKQLLPSFVAAYKEGGQVAAYMSCACLVWFLCFSDPTDEDVFVNQDFKYDPAYKGYIWEVCHKASPLINYVLHKLAEAL